MMGLVPASALSKRLNPKIGQYVLLIDHSHDGDVANVFGQVIPIMLEYVLMELRNILEIFQDLMMREKRGKMRN